jgi:hypothetical protein
MAVRESFKVGGHRRWRGGRMHNLVVHHTRGQQQGWPDGRGRWQAQAIRNSPIQFDPRTDLGRARDSECESRPSEVWQGEAKSRGPRDSRPRKKCEPKRESRPRKCESGA